MTCPRCRIAMIPRPEPIDHSRAGDAPSPDARLAGILVEVLRCPSCRCQALRPARLDISEDRLAIA